MTDVKTEYNPPPKKRGFLRRYWMYIGFFFGVFALAYYKLSFYYENGGMNEAAVMDYFRVQAMIEQSDCPNKASNALADNYLTYGEAIAVYRCHNRGDKDDEHRVPTGNNSNDNN